MNRVCSIGIIVSSLAVGGMQSALAQSGERPAQATNKTIVRSTPEFITPMESTLVERLRRMDAVLRVKILGEGRSRAVDAAEQVRRESPGIVMKPVPVVVTESPAQILEVIKPHPFAGVVGAQIKIGMSGGDADFGEYRVVDSGKTPPLIPGADYLLFLGYSPDFGVMMGNAFDVFRLDRPRVEAIGVSARTRYKREVVELEAEDALNAVRVALTAAAAQPAP
jgi:hypothetical protein